MNPTQTQNRLKELFSSHPSLSDHERHEVANHLQATLVDLIDLTLIGKQLHWNVTGQRFRGLHLMLDELVDSWRGFEDEVAERINALGLCPDGRATTVAQTSEIKEVSDGPVPDSEVVSGLTERLAQTIARIRERLPHVSELDAPSEDLLIEISETLEQNHWMLAVQQS